MKYGKTVIDSITRSNLSCLLFIFVLSVLLMFKQLAIPGYFSVIGNDAYTYTGWAWQFAEALKEGISYPRWMPLDMWGYGSPTFIIYPPLSFYMVALFSLFTSSVTLAMNICLFVSLFVSGAGIFFLSREFFDNRVALLSALLYLLLPYNILQFYLMGSFASKISFMWFSPILLFIHRYGTERQIKYLVFASLCYSGLILTHIINAYMFTFVLLTFIAFFPFREKRFKDGLKMLSVVPISILLSAAYLLPLVAEKYLVNMKGFFLKGSGYHYSAYFLLAESSANQLPYFSKSLYYDMFLLHTCLFVLIITWICLVVARTKCYYKNNDGKVYYWYLISIALFSLFMLFSPSTFLWETLPFIKYIHFPFRWMVIINFAAGLLCAYVFNSIKHAANANRIIFFSIALLLLLFVVMDVHYIRRANIFNESELVPIRAAYSSKDHQLPWVVTDKLDKQGGYEKKLDLAHGEGKVEAIAWKSAERLIHVEVEQPVTLKIRTFNFPGWTARVDGQEEKMRTEDKTGVMLIDVPKGIHRVKLTFGDTPVRYYGKIISLVTITALFLLVIIQYHTEKNKNKLSC